MASNGDRAPGVDQLGQRGQAVGRAFGIGGDQDRDPTRPDRQLVAAGRQLLGGRQPDAQRNAAGGLPRPGLGQVRQAGGQGGARNAADRDLHPARQVQRAAARIQPGPQRRGQDSAARDRLGGGLGGGPSGGIDGEDPGRGGPHRRVGRRAAGQPGLVGERRHERQAFEPGLGIDHRPGAGDGPRRHALGRHIVVRHRIEFGQLVAFQLQGDADRSAGREPGEGRRRRQAIEVAVDVGQGEGVAVGVQDRGDAAEIQRPAGGRGLRRGQGQLGQVAGRRGRAGGGTGAVVEHRIADVERGGEAIELGLAWLGLGARGGEGQGGQRDQASWHGASRVRHNPNPRHRRPSSPDVFGRP
jgi:hypothetical protein